jgi:hypothetical protein
LLALVLIATLLMTFAKPGRAEALELLTIVAIASAAAVVVIIIVYLVVANMSDKRRADLGELRYLACIESDMAPRTCWAMPRPPASAITAQPAALTQSP